MSVTTTMNNDRFFGFPWHHPDFELFPKGIVVQQFGDGDPDSPEEILVEVPQDKH